MELEKIDDWLPEWALERLAKEYAELRPKLAMERGSFVSLFSSFAPATAQIARLARKAFSLLDSEILQASQAFSVQGGAFCLWFCPRGYSA